MRDDAEFGKSEINIHHEHTISVTAYVSVQLKGVVDGVVEEIPEGNNLENSTIGISDLPQNGIKRGKGIEQRYQVNDDKGNTYDALLLAEKCYESWIAFLTRNGLPV